MCGSKLLKSSLFEKKTFEKEILNDYFKETLVEGVRRTAGSNNAKVSEINETFVLGKFPESSACSKISQGN
jgi:hypothetical protein